MIFPEYGFTIYWTIKYKQELYYTIKLVILELREQRWDLFITLQLLSEKADDQLTPSNKSEYLPQILQPWWVVTLFEEFPRNFSRIISCNWFLGNSREIPQNWSPRWEIFGGSQFWDSVSRNSWEILRNFSPRNSSEFLQKYSLEIPEKFLGLCHHVYGFFGEFIKRISFEKFSWLLLRKFLRNS